MAAYEVLAGGHLDTLLPLTRSRYARQCAALLDALDQFFTGRAHWTRPAGGMFVWVELAAAVDATALLAQAIKRQVAFVPGAAFYPVGAHANPLRLSFVTVAAEQLQVGVERLARCLDEPAAEATNDVEPDAIADAANSAVTASALLRDDDLRPASATVGG